MDDSAVAGGMEVTMKLLAAGPSDETAVEVADVGANVCGGPVGCARLLLLGVEITEVKVGGDGGGIPGGPAGGARLPPVAKGAAIGGVGAGKVAVV